MLKSLSNRTDCSYNHITLDLVQHFLLKIKILKMSNFPFVFGSVEGQTVIFTECTFYSFCEHLLPNSIVRVAI